MSSPYGKTGGGRDLAAVWEKVAMGPDTPRTDKNITWERGNKTGGEVQNAPRPAPSPRPASR